MGDSEKFGLARVVGENGSHNKRKYPTQEFHAFVAAARRYIDPTRRDRLVHKNVVQAINGLTEFLRLERKRIPGGILYEADRLECMFFAGYDPHFEGGEPRGSEARSGT